MIHLAGLEIRSAFASDAGAFPFSVPAIHSVLDRELCFGTPITFLVGENGSGKSTLLEGIACAAELPGIGTDDPSSDPTLAHGRALAEATKLRWRLRHPHRGYFFRAEDFFGFTKRMDRVRAELRAGLQDVLDDSSLSDRARLYGSVPFRSELDAIRVRYGESGLDARSHGEQFLDLFGNRCRPGGVYLMDEPEAPLSPARQLTFLSMLKTMAGEDAQFIIAKHSPMLLALPGATILSFDDGGIREASFETLEHTRIVRSFLEDPDSYLRHL